MTKDVTLANMLGTIIGVAYGAGAAKGEADRLHAERVAVKKAAKAAAEAKAARKLNGADSDDDGSDTTDTDTDTEEYEDEDDDMPDLFSDTPVEAEPAATVTEQAFPGFSQHQQQLLIQQQQQRLNQQQQQQQQHQEKIPDLASSESSLPYQPRQRCDQAHPCQNCVRRRLQNKRESIKVAKAKKLQDIEDEKERIRKSNDISLMDIFGSLLDFDEEEVAAIEKTKKWKEATAATAAEAEKAKKAEEEEEEEAVSKHTQQTKMTNLLLPKKKTKSELTPRQLEAIDRTGALQGYPKSSYFVIGYRLFHNREFLTKNKTQKLAMDAFLKGCVQEGCVPCMFYYCHMQLALGRVHLALPWLLEGAIRGHLPCQHRLVNECYNEAAPEEVDVLSNFWAKILISHGSHYITEDMRNDARTKNGNHCFSCGKKEHSAADTAVAADGSSSLPLSKFTDPDSGVDITVTPHRRNPEPKEEATSKKSRSKDEDGVLDISVIPPWRRKEVTPATVKKSNFNGERKRRLNERQIL